jgi:hypothetical protein
MARVFAAWSPGAPHKQPTACARKVLLNLHLLERRSPDGLLRQGADNVVDTTAQPELFRKAADALALRGALALVDAAKPGTEATFEIGLFLVKAGLQGGRAGQLRAAGVHPEAHPVSGVSEAGELLVGPAREAFQAKLTARGHRPTAAVRVAQLGQATGLIGATDLARV